MLQRLKIREPFCGLSHFVGIVLAVIALVVLLVLSRGRPLHLLAFSIYGVSLILVYLTSTLYHSLPESGRRGQWLLRFDYMAIFLLIAGTYAPVCLLALPRNWGLGLIITEYTLAAVGIVTVLFNGGPDLRRVLLYVCMGWLSLIAIGPLCRSLPAGALWWLFGGGVVYSVGVVVFATDRPHLWPGKFCAHDLWHLFVLGGSACHFVMMARYLT